VPRDEVRPGLTELPAREARSVDRALALEEVALTRDGNEVLAGISWSVAPDERWVVLGPNGSGKTTLLQIAGARLHPSRGDVEILGDRLGASDWRAVRARVGFVSGAVVRSLRPSLTAREIVVTGLHGALEPWWHTYTDAERARAEGLLGTLGVAPVADRAFGVISEGERQQVLLARALMADPGLLLLDEPFAGLDPGAAAQVAPLLAGGTRVLISHDVEAGLAAADAVLGLRGGRVAFCSRSAGVDDVRALYA
ncbi:MAG TPA: ATP-binding cassette domain-containing protein, partial [Solirubrobacter sp.]|nr:ATP-binding cassette domain-containing protein [Solirubrobacter sp.]